MLLKLWVSITGLIWQRFCAKRDCAARTDGNRLEVLVDQTHRLVPGSAVPNLLAMVLGRIPDARMAGLLSGVLLKRLLRPSVGMVNTGYNSASTKC